MYMYNGIYTKVTSGIEELEISPYFKAALMKASLAAASSTMWLRATGELESLVGGDS